MQNSLLPDQIGFVPASSGSGIYKDSKFVLGKNITGTWESIGFGPNGQPNILQEFVINISTKGQNPSGSHIKIVMNEDIISTVLANPNAPKQFSITIKEASICEDSIEKRMLILGSQTYLPPP